MVFVVIAVGILEQFVPAQVVIESEPIGVGKVPFRFGLHSVLEVFISFPQPVGPLVIRPVVRAVVQRRFHLAEGVPLAILERIFHSYTRPSSA